MIRLINIKVIRFSTLTTTLMDQSQHKEGATVIKEHNRELFLEGKAKIYTKYVQKNSNGKLVENGVFYNPVQIFNRDFTLLVMQAYIDQMRQQRNEKFNGVKIIDALSASGLRTIRFLKQLNGVKMVYANDISAASHKLMRDNFDLNQLDEEKLKMTMEDANLLLQNQKKNIMFDIIDLDPYGSVVPFLDSAVESIQNGGLMCVTCTDTKVTCGPDIAKCYYYYGTTRAKVHHFNENALRIVLSTISSAASRHCKYIEPLISFQTDFYLRVFFIVRRGKTQCAESGVKIGNIYNCNSCGNYEYHSHLKQKTNKKGHLVPNRNIINSSHCKICEEPYCFNGPVWLAPLNKLSFVDRLMEMMKKEDFSLQLKTHKKIFGTLHAIANEKQLSEIPLGFNFDLMCKHIKAPTPNRKLLYAGLESLNFKVEPSYITPGIYKTNAPWEAIYDIIKVIKKKELGEQKFLSNVKSSESLKILQKQIQFQPDFDYKGQKHHKLPHFMSMGAHMGPKGKPESRLLTQEQIMGIKNQSNVEKQ